MKTLFIDNHILFIFQITKKLPRMITRLKLETKDVLIAVVILGLSIYQTSGQNQNGKY